MKALRTTGIALFCLLGCWFGLMAARPPWIQPVPGVRLEPEAPLPGEEVATPGSAADLLRQADAALPPDAMDRWRNLPSWTGEGQRDTAWAADVASLLADCAPAIALSGRAALAREDRLPSPPAYAGLGDLDTANRFILLHFLRADAAVLREQPAEVLTALSDAACVARLAQVTRAFSGCVWLAGNTGTRSCRLLHDLPPAKDWPDAEAEWLAASLRRLDLEAPDAAEVIRVQWVFSRRFAADFRRDPEGTLTAMHGGYGLPAIVRHLGWLSVLLLDPPSDTLRSVDALYSHLVALAQKPYDDLAYRALEPSTGGLWHLLSRRDPIGRVALMLYASGNPDRELLRARSAIRAARVLLAALCFRAVEGRYPSGAEELVPAWLEAVPVDPFDGQPLRTRADPELGFVVYSVGPDGKDDGGVDTPGSGGGRDLVF